MRITEIIFVAALASTAAAQTIAQEIALLPSCSASCISDAISLATTCGDTDYACQCSTTNSAAIFDSAGACLLNACSSADLLTAASVMKRICSLALGAQNSSSTTSTSQLATRTAAWSTVQAATTSPSSSSFSSSEANPVSTSFSSSLSGQANPVSTSSSSSLSGQAKPITTSSKSGLSTGATVGIGVGAGSFVALLTASVVWLIIRYRRRGRELKTMAVAAAAVPRGEENDPGVPELDETESRLGTVLSGVDSRGPSETIWSVASEIDGKEHIPVWKPEVVELHPK